MNDAKALWQNIQSGSARQGSQNFVYKIAQEATLNKIVLFLFGVAAYYLIDLHAWRLYHEWNIPTSCEYRHKV